jgi:hypothetical protein
LKKKPKQEENNRKKRKSKLIILSYRLEQSHIGLNIEIYLKD